MMKARVLALATLAACSGTTRPRPVMPTCSTATQPGLHARSLTWNGSGWGAVVADGATLFLREFNVDGTVRGEALPLLEERATPPREWERGLHSSITPGGVASTLRERRPESHAGCRSSRQNRLIRPRASRDKRFRSTGEWTRTRLRKV